MPRRAPGLGTILVLFAISCSCPQGGSRSGGITQEAELQIERIGDNCLPLEPCNIGGEDGDLTVRYLFTAADCLCTSEPFFIGPDPEVWTVTLNGAELPGANGRYFISGTAHEGENVIEMRGSGDIPQVYIKGEIGVFPTEEGGWRVSGARPLELGPLSAQGLPFYEGAVSYSRMYEVPERVGRRILRIPSWKGETCELRVNGEKVTDVPTSPFKMNIGPYLSPGTNGVEILIADHGDFGLIKDFTLK